jgi:hypothetical protein
MTKRASMLNLLKCQSRIKRWFIAAKLSDKKKMAR